MPDTRADSSPIRYGTCIASHTSYEIAQVGRPSGACRRLDSLSAQLLIIKNNPPSVECRKWRFSAVADRQIPLPPAPSMALDDFANRSLDERNPERDC
jgi:hypothetical protein